MTEWRAGYSESCKSGSGASARKPTAAMRQGAGYLAYSIERGDKIQMKIIELKLTPQQALNFEKITALVEETAAFLDSLP